MKLIVIERFRDLKTKSKELPQGKDREIDEVFDVDDKRANELLDKGWVRKADNICDDKKTKKDGSTKENHNDEEKNIEITNSNIDDSQDNKKDDSIKENHDDEEKNIKNANSNIDNQLENKNDDDKDIEKK